MVQIIRMLKTRVTHQGACAGHWAAQVQDYKRTEPFLEAKNRGLWKRLRPAGRHSRGPFALRARVQAGVLFRARHGPDIMGVLQASMTPGAWRSYSGNMRIRFRKPSASLEAGDTPNA